MPIISPVQALEHEISGVVEGEAIMGGDDIGGDKSIHQIPRMIPGQAGPNANGTVSYLEVILDSCLLRCNAGNNCRPWAEDRGVLRIRFQGRRIRREWARPA